MKYALLLFTLFIAVAAEVEAGWLKVAENDRLVTYIDSTNRTSQNNKIVWVLFDYKTVQESLKSGRQYFSEKAQYEIDCAAERARVLFFTWHSECMGNGTVVYTGNNSTDWEPTSAPDSIASVLWKYTCDITDNIPAREQSTFSLSNENKTVEQVAAEIADQHNAANLTDDMTVSSIAEARGKQIIFKNVLRVKKDLTMEELNQFMVAIKDEIIPKTCIANSANVAFMQMGLYYTFVYVSTYGQKLAEISVYRAACDRWESTH